MMKHDNGDRGAGGNCGDYAHKGLYAERKV